MQSPFRQFEERVTLNRFYDGPLLRQKVAIINRNRRFVVGQIVNSLYFYNVSVPANLASAKTMGGSFLVAELFGESQWCHHWSQFLEENGNGVGVFDKSNHRQ